MNLRRLKALFGGLIVVGLFSGMILTGHDGSPTPTTESDANSMQGSADDSMLAAAGKKQQAEGEITQTCSTLALYNSDITAGDNDSDTGWDRYNTGETYMGFEQWHDAWHKFDKSVDHYDNATSHYADALQHAKDCTGSCANSNHPY